MMIADGLGFKIIDGLPSELIYCFTCTNLILKLKINRIPTFDFFF